MVATATNQRNRLLKICVPLTHPYRKLWIDGQRTCALYALSIHIYLALYGRSCIHRQLIDDIIPSFQQYRSTHFISCVCSLRNHLIPAQTITKRCDFGRIDKLEIMSVKLTGLPKFEQIEPERATLKISSHLEL